MQILAYILIIYMTLRVFAGIGINYNNRKYHKEEDLIRMPYWVYLIDFAIILYIAGLVTR